MTFLASSCGIFVGLNSADALTVVLGHHKMKKSLNSSTNLQFQRNADNFLKSQKSTALSIWQNDRKIKIRAKQGKRGGGGESEGEELST